MNVTYAEYKPYGEDPDGYWATIDGERVGVPMDPLSPYYVAVQDAIANGLVVQPASDYLTPEDRAVRDFAEAAHAEARARLATKLGRTVEEVDSLGLYGIIEELDEEEVVTSVNKLDSDNALVYADGAQPVRDSSGGWYYTNTGGGNKINWYVYTQDLAADKQFTIGEMKSIWFDFFPRSNTTRIPFIVLYTVPQGDGNDGASWYRSRFVYELEPAPTPWQSTNGVYRGHVMYVGENPNVFPQYPHHQLTQAGYSSAGPQGDDEVVNFFAIGSDSSEGAGGYNFAINNTGSEWSEGSIATVLNGVEEAAAPEAHTTNKLDSDNPLVYADGDEAARDVEGGWYYTNPGSPNKINWYVLATDPTSDTVLTVGDMKTLWFDFRPRSDNSRIPFIIVYTRFQGDGNDGGTWYRSRFNYELEPAPAWSPVLPGVYAPKLMYVGDNPNSHPNMEHIELQYAGYASAGPQADDEVVQYVAISTDSSASAGVYNFAINNTGSGWINGSITTVLNGVKP